MTPRKPIVVLLPIILAVLLLAGILFLFFHPKKGNPSEGGGENKTIDAITIQSDIAKTTTQYTVNYGNNTDPNQDAVKQPYKIFGLQNLGLTDDVKSSLEGVLTNVLNRQVTPTSVPTFIQIKRDSIKCDSLANCSLSFYIDSPEMYFDFSTKQDGQTTYGTLTQQPWQGVKK
jgi:hypothetical protein